MTIRLPLVAAVALGLCTAAVTVFTQAKPAPKGSTNATATAQIAAAAQAVLTSLDEPARAKVQFGLGGPKTSWSNLPVTMVKREGIRLGDLTAPQKAAVMKLLSTALSPMGYTKVVDIMRGDEVLKRQSNGRGPTFGEDEYYLAFFGTPSATDVWMLQFGGHHLAINLTMSGASATMAPSLPAAQPATFTWEGKQLRPLGRENDKAFALINALDASQREQAILKSRVADLVLGPGQDGRTIQPEGIRASALTPAQQNMLWDIAREWAGIQHDAYAAPRMSEIQANTANTYFAWSGPTTPGSVAYFRIQGPSLVIEYAPQKSVDHIHTIYRDPTNDYGQKFAKK